MNEATIHSEEHSDESDESTRDAFDRDRNSRLSLGVISPEELRIRHRCRIQSWRTDRDDREKEAGGSFGSVYNVQF